MSYGDPQTVQVIAKRSLGAVTLKYTINGGTVQTAPTTEWRAASATARRRHLLPSPARPGDRHDRATGWRSGSRAPATAANSDSFTYTARSRSAARVLVVAAEDYSGISPPYKKPDPSYLSYYLDALAANGIAGRRLRRRRQRPQGADPLGVLGHYDAVIWYTGDDIITRDAGWCPGPPRAWPTT